MRRMKFKFELYVTINHKSYKSLKPETRSQQNDRIPLIPERLTDNGMLDTFLHRIRLERMNMKQIRQPEQTRTTSPKPTN